MRQTLSALALFLPTVAVAQETVGTLSGTLDGVQVDYTIVDGEDIRTGWREAEDGIEVEIEAYPADAPMDMDNADRLRLRFVADTASRNPEAMEADAELRRDGQTVTATDDAVALSLGSVEVTDDSLLLTGNIRTTMAEGSENVEVLSDEGITLSADMQATVIRADESGS